jgi:molecular chaperone DnaK
MDLGTTNSAAAVFDGERLDLVRNAQGATLTPSVVRIDARGHVAVGVRARRMIDQDPENVRSEFKRLMGSPHTLAFAASGARKRPEELSAEVLRALREDVRAQTGVLPERAVVSVPALFELPQTAATSDAARLAGFERVEIIQEPVASALAAGWKAEDSGGPWIVYDFGGGTFDVSLLETQDGLLRVVGHDGDNFLGGRDFDAAIVDWAIERIREEHGVNLARADPSHGAALRRLRVAAEDAKIELTRAREAEIAVAGLEVGGRNLDVALLLDRARRRMPRARRAGLDDLSQLPAGAALAGRARPRGRRVARSGGGRGRTPSRGPRSCASRILLTAPSVAPTRSRRRSSVTDRGSPPSSTRPRVFVYDPLS